MYLNMFLTVIFPVNENLFQMTGIFSRRVFLALFGAFGLMSWLGTSLRVLRVIIVLTRAMSNENEMKHIITFLTGKTI